MPHFRPREEVFIQAIQLTVPLTIKIDKGELAGVIGDWLIMSHDGLIVTIIDQQSFWYAFKELEE